MNKGIEEYIVLLVICTCPNLSNSYDLNKISSWKFGVINVSDKLDKLTHESVLERDYAEKNYRYKCTDIGVRLLLDNYSYIKRESLSKFPLQSEFLRILFKKFESLNELKK